MPYFYVNADKKPYRLRKIEKHDGQYMLFASRLEEHYAMNLGARVLRQYVRHSTFIAPSTRKMDIRVEDRVYSCKKADPMTVECLVNHLSTLFDLEQL